MQDLTAQIETYKKEIESFDISSPQQLEAFRIKFLGSRGIVKSLFAEMKNVPAIRPAHSSQ